LADIVFSSTCLYLRLLYPQLCATLNVIVSYQDNRKTFRTSCLRYYATYRCWTFTMVTTDQKWPKCLYHLILARY